ncbi:MAG: hypothetical protein K2X39_05285, partial [Silvanigrellaceae bacterium]|nr:hypothetical protein [Silvanigrellaceae bacterium]
MSRIYTNALSERLQVVLSVYLPAQSEAQSMLTELASTKESLVNLINEQSLRNEKIYTQHASGLIAHAKKFSKIKFESDLSNTKSEILKKINFFIKI